MSPSSCRHMACEPRAVVFGFVMTTAGVMGNGERSMPAGKLGTGRGVGKLCPDKSVLVDSTGRM